MAFEHKNEFDVKFLEYSENLKELRDQIGNEGAIINKIEKLVSDFFGKIISWLQLLEAIVLQEVGAKQEILQIKQSIIDLASQINSWTLDHENTSNILQQDIQQHTSIRESSSRNRPSKSIFR